MDLNSNKNKKLFIALAIVVTKGLYIICHKESNSIRRVHPGGMENLLPIQQKIAMAKLSRDAGMYEPYWEDGHWVFDRIKYNRTRMPLGNILNTGSTQNKECDQICLTVYEDYGEVCAQRFKTGKYPYYYNRWTYEYKTFANMCEIEFVNCVQEYKRWYPIHRGHCPELSDRTSHPTNPSQIFDRVKKWLSTVPEW